MACGEWLKVDSSHKNNRLCSSVERYLSIYLLLGELMEIRLPIDNKQLATFCRRHHIIRLSLFGSELRSEATSNSDIDLLVAFEQGQEPGLIGISKLEAELSDLMEGRPVDLRTANDLSRHFREEVIQTAAVLYAR